MDTYFIRHTQTLGIDEATLRALWEAQKIAIHFPQDKTGELRDQDNDSLELDDYKGSDRKAMKALKTLAETGGYVCAQYHGFKQTLVGLVAPKSEIQVERTGKWGTRYPVRPGRPAILKTLKITKWKLIEPSESVALLVGRPRQGTLMRWHGIKQRIADLVEERETPAVLDHLSTAQQEILCSEFLRLDEAGTLGLPILRHLLLLGRTMKDLDIYGLATDQKPIYAQVTFTADEATKKKKLDSLRKYCKPENHVILFCKCEAVYFDGEIKVYPIGLVFDRFRCSLAGELWLSLALDRGRPSVEDSCSDALR